MKDLSVIPYLRRPVLFLGVCLLMPLVAAAQEPADGTEQLREQREELQADVERLEARAQRLAEQIRAEDLSQEEIRRETLALREEAMRLAQEATAEAQIEVQEARREVAEAAREAAEEMRAWSWVYKSESANPEPETYFGISAEPVPSVLRDYVDLPKGVGLLLPMIAKDSPAEKAGLKANDILVEVDGQTIVNFSQLSTLINLRKPGDTLSVKVLRKGEPVEVDVTLEERLRRGGRFVPVPEPPAPPAPPPAPGAPPAPAPDAEDEVGFHLHEWIPSTVNVVVDDQQRVHVDLRDLRENLALLQSKLAQLRLEDISDWEDIVQEYGSEMNPRTTVVLMEEGAFSYQGPDGSVDLTTEDDVEQVVVRDPQGKLLYEGALPEDYEESLDAEAVRVLRGFQDSRRQISTRVTDGKELRIEVQTNDEDKMTLRSLAPPASAAESRGGQA